MNDTATSARADKLMNDLRVFVADAEELLRHAGTQTGDGAADVRSRIQASLYKAKATLADMQQAAAQRARAAGHAADDYVHEHPWQSVSLAAGIGVLIGMLIARR
ncbi:MAG TPA: DUF883 family protein [Methylibium sp.]|nr:DUF883 family protein [Methylibium sp.]